MRAPSNTTERRVRRLGAERATMRHCVAVVGEHGAVRAAGEMDRTR